MIDLDALEAAAKAATPGEWRVSPANGTVYATNEKIGGDAPVCEMRGYGYLTGKGHGGLGLPHKAAIKQQIDTATFIAAANPAIVLEMIAEIERLRDAESRRARLADEYAGALNEIERLREALRPFANAAGEYLQPDAPDDCMVDYSDGLVIGDLRRARAALESKA